MDPIYRNNWYEMYQSSIPWYYNIRPDFDNPNWNWPNPNQLAYYNESNARRRIDNAWRWTYTWLVDNWWGAWTIPWTATYTPNQWYSTIRERNGKMYNINEPIRWRAVYAPKYVYSVSPDGKMYRQRAWEETWGRNPKWMLRQNVQKTMQQRQQASKITNANKPNVWAAKNAKGKTVSARGRSK